MGSYEDSRDKDFGQCPGRKNKGGGRQHKGSENGLCWVLVVVETAGKYGLLSVKLEDSNSADCSLLHLSEVSLIGFSTGFTYNIYIHALCTVTRSK
jgi:hypothetical protein